MSAPTGSRTLVARLDSLGDVLLAGPAVRAAQAASSEVLMLTSSRGRAAARLLPGVDGVLTFDAPWVLFDPPAVSSPAVMSLVESVAAAKITTALILTSYHQSPLPLALLLRMAGVRWIGGICTDYPGSLLDLRHRVADGIAESERNLSLATAAGFAADSDGAVLRLRQPLPDCPPVVGPGRYVVFHPGAAVPARRPTTEHARAIVTELVRSGRRVLITGGGAERELTARVSSVAPDWTCDLGGRLQLGELASVLQRADVVVAPNTGPAHLAAAVGTPVVSLFAPVVGAQAWAPYGVPRRILGRQDAPCRGTRARDCPVPGHPCLSSVSPATVVAAVEELTPVDRTGEVPL